MFLMLGAAAAAASPKLLGCYLGEAATISRWWPMTSRPRNACDRQPWVSMVTVG